MTASIQLRSPFSRSRTVSQTEADEVRDLVGAEASGLLSYFRRRVSPAEDAADLLSETLLVIWRRMDSIPPDETGRRMWMYGIARNVLATHRRTIERRSSLADRLRIEISLAPAWAKLDGGPQEEHEDLHEFIRALVADLPPRDQEIVMLHHWEGFGLSEIAAMTGMRETTVRSRYFRLRAQLKSALVESGDLVPDSSGDRATTEG